MNKKLATGFLIGAFVVGTVLAAAPDAKSAFVAAKGKAAGFHAKFIAHASPQVRAKISASAAAGRKYLAGCGRNCSYYRFLTGDLNRRFQGLTGQQLRVLITLVFAETFSGIGDDSQLADIELQNAQQEQQQMIETISEVEKMVNDTAMSVIRNIKG